MKIRRTMEVLAYAEPTNPWLKVYFDHVESPSGEKGRYNRVVENDGIPGVAILPIRGSDIGLVRQFRYPAGKEMVEIPRGFSKTNDALKEARRELQEETGLIVPKGGLVELGMVNPNSGVLATEVHIFAVRISSDIPIDPEYVEDGTKFEWHPLDEIVELISDGEITDAFTLSAFFLAIQHGMIELK